MTPQAIDRMEQRALVPAGREGQASPGGMQFRILGPLEVDAGSGPIPLGGPKQRAVLAHLLIRANELVPTETLVAEIWGEDLPENARNVIQTYVSHLRKALGPDRIQGHAPGYRLWLDPSESDAARFDALVRDGKKTLPVDPTTAVVALEDALALWRGPALADLADQPSLAAEATRLDEGRLEAQEDRIEGLLACGAQARAIGGLESLLAHHPWRESLWGLLMVALYREGRQAEALNAYQRAREILADELGIDPSPELTKLHERVLNQDPGLELRGEPLRGYRLLEKIDEGPTGVVFRAIQPHVERDVAVKIFHEQVASDPAFVRRFEQEAQAVAALEHPHIAPIYDYWREPGRAYIVSRYFRGGSLRALEERGEALEPDRALGVVGQIASALAFAHRQGIAHGSVRPSNVLFDPEGNAYLGDFPVGVGPEPDPTIDVRDIAALARRSLPTVPPHLAELIERAEVGIDAPDADAFAQAARAPFEPETVPGPRRVDERNPYKGLRAFTEADARDFFGRGALTQALVAGLSGDGSGYRFLAVVGPSGGGKSSVVRAGLVPEIRRGALGDPESTFIAEMFPGAHPIEELEAALLRIAVRPASGVFDRLDSGSRGLLEAVDLVTPGTAEVVLVVDQFEEVFTLATDERERELFLEALRVGTADPDSRLRVVVTLRADFYDRPLVYPRFGELLAARTEAVPPLTPDELEQAIRGPVEQVGVTPEPGLVAEMIADVAHQPGALPLLQYALTELFERRDVDRLTLASYREIGGVAGALSARADRIVEASEPDGRRAIKQVFLRLVTLGEGRQDTRRRVARSELASLEVEPEAIEAALDAFGRHRFLTFDREPSTREPTVEIAHEALLSAWGRLRTWIDDAREDLRQDRRLARAASEWRAADRDPSFLIRGARLDQVESWSAATSLAIGRPERAYLKASVDERERERSEEEWRRDHEAQVERRSVRRLRGLVAVFAVAAIVAGSLTIVATRQSEKASREARLATARELAAAAVANLEIDPERSLLLAMEAVGTTRSWDGTVLAEAEEALHRAVVASRIVTSVPGVGGRLDWSPSGDVFATEGSDGSGVVDIRDVDTGRSIRSFPGHDGDITDVAFSPDGSMLATTGVDGSLKVWDPDDGALLDEVTGIGEALGPSFSGDGRLAAAAWPEEGAVHVVSISTHRVLRTFGDLLGANATSFGPGGARIAVSTLQLADDESDWFSQVYVFDVASSERFRVEELDARQVADVAWGPDGDLVAAGADASLVIWEAATGELLHELPGHAGFITSVDWRPEASNQVLVTGAEDGTARVWRIDELGATRTMSLLSSGMTDVTGVAFSPDGTRVMTGNEPTSPRVKIWDVSPAGSAEWANLPADIFGDALFISARRMLASGGRGPLSDLVTLWDVEAASEPRRVRTFDLPRSRPCCAWHLDVSADGATAAMAFWEDGASVRDVATGDELFFVPAPRSVASPFDLSPDGRYMAVGMGRYRAAGIFYSTDFELGVYRAVRILDRSGREVGAPLREDGGFQIDSFEFAPDTRFIAIASHRGADQRVRIWDRERGVIVTEIAGARFEPGPYGAPAFDPSGRLIAFAAGRQVRIWDVETGALVATLPSQPAEILAVVFSPDGASVATAASDRTVRLFDVRSETERLVLHGSDFDAHSAALVDLGALYARSVAFSPDGSLLASVDGTTVRVWVLDIDILLEIARQNVTRSLTDEECRQYLHVEACPADLAFAEPTPA